MVKISVCHSRSTTNQTDWLVWTDKMTTLSWKCALSWHKFYSLCANSPSPLSETSDSDGGGATLTRELPSMAMAASSAAILSEASIMQRTQTELHPTDLFDCSLDQGNTLKCITHLQQHVIQNAYIQHKLSILSVLWIRHLLAEKSGSLFARWCCNTPHPLMFTRDADSEIHPSRHCGSA